MLTRGIPLPMGDRDLSPLLQGRLSLEVTMSWCPHTILSPWRCDIINTIYSIVISSSAPTGLDVLQREILEAADV